MKRRLVESNTGAPVRHRDRRSDRRRRQQLDRDRAVAAHGRRRRHHGRRSGRRGRAGRAASRPGARRATTRPSKAALAELEARRQGRPQHHGAVDRCAQAPASPPASGARRCAACSASTARRPASRQSAVARDGAGARRASAPRSTSCPTKLGRRIKFLVGKPGLDGHSNGAEQIAVRARDVGMEVVYEGIRLTPAQIVRAAVDESVHVVGLSILSGSHVPLVQEVMERMRKEGLGDMPVVVGGIIPPEDEKHAEGVRRRRRLHAQGLPAQRHHGRHRAAGRQPGHGRLTARVNNKEEARCVRKPAASWSARCGASASRRSASAPRRSSLIGAFFVYEDYDARVENVRVPATVIEVGPLNIRSTKMVEEGLVGRRGARRRAPRQRHGAEDDRPARRRSRRDHRAPPPHRARHLHLEVGAASGRVVTSASSPAISTSSPSVSRT